MRFAMRRDGQSPVKRLSEKGYEQRSEREFGRAGRQNGSQSAVLVLCKATGQAPLTLFGQSQGEVQRSPTPIGPGAPARGCPYPRVLCARRKDRSRGGLRASGRGAAKSRSPARWERGSSDPMIDAGAPSTGVLQV